MRKFTTLFLLALAMTIGANQAFAQDNTGASNDNGKQDSVGRGDKDDNDDSDDNGDGDNDGSTIPTARLLTPGDFVRVGCIARPCFPPRRPKPIMVEKKDDCSCKHKVMRVNGRFMPFIDCYNTVLINGREQLSYCEK